jgi:hypothetical protein
VVSEGSLVLNGILKVSSGLFCFWNVNRHFMRVWLVFAHYPSTREAESGGLQVQGQPGLHSETLS